MSDLLEPLPLTGADCFLLAFEGEVRRKTGASHVSQIVLRLGPGFDVEAFRRVIGEVAAANPILRAPIRRQALVGAPMYFLDRAAPAPGVGFAVHPTGTPLAESMVAPALGAVPEVFYRRFNSRFDARRGRVMHVDVAPRGGAVPGTDVALTWQHMLLDGNGSERFVEHLAACAADPSLDRNIAITRGEGGASSPAAAELPAASGQRGRMAQTWQRYMEGLATRPPGSLAGPLRRVQQELRYDELRLEGESAVAATTRAKQLAGFLTPMLFYLAVSMRAHQAVAERRGKVPKSYVVPLPVNLRPKGGQGEVFRTHVSLLWFQVTPEETRDLAAMIEVLKAQRLEAIRNKLVEAGVAAMDFARYAPGPVYSYMARRSFGGELSSFFFAYTGDFAAGAASLCGAEILDGFHAPPVPASPGSALAFSLRGGGLNVTHVHQRGVLDAAELALFRESILEDLGGR
ncbi:MAG: hypothetical protein ABR538_02575 [Candidatus Binatia bacterium]